MPHAQQIRWAAAVMLLSCGAGLMSHDLSHYASGVSLSIQPTSQTNGAIRVRSGLAIRRQSTRANDRVSVLLIVHWLKSGLKIPIRYALAGVNRTSSQKRIAGEKPARLVSAWFQHPWVTMRLYVPRSDRISKPSTGRMPQQ
jgi:hypothetical protein